MNRSVPTLEERQRILHDLWPSGGVEPMPVRPRATSGDQALEPDWEQRLTVAVGQKEGDILGTDQRAIQAAVDYVAGFGGGTVRILPGTYRFRNAVYLRSNVRLIGSGQNTILAKEVLAETKLAEDSDWFDQEITLVNGQGFEVGDGICLETIDPQADGEVVLRRTIVARSGSRFKLDRALRENMWMMQGTTVSTIFPLLTAEGASQIIIEDLSIDGNGENNRLISGNYAACIWLQDNTDIVIRRVTAANYNGDGIVWGVCHDVLVEDCHVHNNAGIGLHPGSGSQRPIIRRNRVECNDRGIYFCWGVKWGLAEANSVSGNLRHGISIGHHDDCNVVRGNLVERAGEAGILFRAEGGKGFTPKGNRVENNRVMDTGGEDGVAVDVEGVTHGNTIARNTLSESRGPARRIGIRLGPDSGMNELVDNAIDGFATPIADLRPAGRE